MITGCGDSDKSSTTDSGSTGSTGDTDAGTATDAPTTTTSTTTGACVDDPPTIAVTNGTPWKLAALEFAPCDAPNPAETFPFPNMLEPDQSFDVPLPAAGCYLLGVVEPSGCEVLAPIMTGTLAACEVVPLELSEDQFACPGGAR
jgi:hypothetical protein